MVYPRKIPSGNPTLTIFLCYELIANTRCFANDYFRLLRPNMLRYEYRYCTKNQLTLSYELTTQISNFELKLRPSQLL